MIIYDPKKAAENFKKHGVLFADCETAIYDPNGRNISYEEGGEIRNNTLGMDATGTIVIVTWTERGDDERIISARKASEGERQYYGQ